MFLARHAVGRFVLVAIVWVLLVAIIYLGPFPRAAVSVTGATPAPTGFAYRPPAEPRIEASAFDALVSYLAGVLHGRLGTTVRGQPVARELQRVWYRSVILVGLSVALGLALGIAGAVLERLGRRRWQGLSLVGLSVPEPVVAGAIWVAVVWMIARWSFRPFPVFWVYNINWRHYVLPTIAMSVFPAAYFTQASSTALTEVYRRPFVQVARSKGLSEPQVLFRHIWRHLAFRLCIVLPALIPWSLSILVIVEYLFLVPGLGRAVGYMLQQGAVDPALLSGILALLLGLVAVTQFACALLAPVFDPRQQEREVVE